MLDPAAPAESSAHAHRQHGAGPLLLSNRRLLCWVAAVVVAWSMGRWQAALPNIFKAKVYADEGHTVQYRHWDQILVDMAGYGDHTVVCRNGRTRLVSNDLADEIVDGGATLGLCAWAAAP